MNSPESSESHLKKLVSKLEADLAERREIERELAHMASFADLDPNPIVETSVSGGIGYHNVSAENAFPDLKTKGRLHEIFVGLDKVIERLQKEQCALTMRKVTVGARVYEQQVSVIDGGPRVRLYLSDISEVTRLDQMKNDFVNMVSHEMRTPLTSIGAILKLMNAGVVGTISDQQKELLGIASKNIDRLCRMITDLLDLSKIEEGKVKLQTSRLDIADLIREAVQTFTSLAQERGLTLDSQLPTTSMHVEADRDKLLQVFINLINNAMKFTPSGGIQVGAVLDEDVIRCHVRDTGCGIAAEDLPKMFEKFQQFGHAAQGNDKGSGLGLTLCKRLIELHGGRIWVESKLQEGTTIYFEIPPA